MEVLIDPAGKPVHAATWIYTRPRPRRRVTRPSPPKKLEKTPGEPDTQSHRWFISEHMTAIDDVFVFYINLLDATVPPIQIGLDHSPQAKESSPPIKAG